MLDLLELELHGSWELNLGSPEEQPVFLTTEPSLQPKNVFLRGQVRDSSVPLPFMGELTSTTSLMCFYFIIKVV